MEAHSVSRQVRVHLCQSAEVPLGPVRCSMANCLRLKKELLEKVQLQYSLLLRRWKQKELQAEISTRGTSDSLRDGRNYLFHLGTYSTGGQTSVSGQLCEPGEACTPWDSVLVDIFDKRTHPSHKK